MDKSFEIVDDLEVNIKNKNTFFLYSLAHPTWCIGQKIILNFESGDPFNIDLYKWIQVNELQRRFFC